MARPSSPQAESDASFDANAQIKLETAHDVIKHPDKFAEIFVKAAETQVKVKQIIRKEIRDSLSTDNESKNSVKALIKEQFKEDWRAFVISAWGKLALLFWTLATAIIVGWFTHTFIK